MRMHRFFWGGLFPEIMMGARCGERQITTKHSGGSKMAASQGSEGPPQKRQRTSPGDRSRLGQAAQRLGPPALLGLPMLRPPRGCSMLHQSMARISEPHRKLLARGTMEFGACDGAPRPPLRNVTLEAQDATAFASAQEIVSEEVRTVAEVCSLEAAKSVAEVDAATEVLCLAEALVKSKGINVEQLRQYRQLQETRMDKLRVPLARRVRARQMSRRSGVVRLCGERCCATRAGPPYVAG
jgi:hypothetical protein